MRTYYVTPGTAKSIEIRAENIDNLRRNIIRDYGSELKRGAIFYVSVPIGPKGRGIHSPIGSLDYHEKSPQYPYGAPTGYYWTYRIGKTETIAKVSPRTGGLLKIEAHWSRISIDDRRWRAWHPR